MNFRTLEARGIATIAKKYQWQPQNFRQNAGWIYPVFHYQTEAIIAKRWKAAVASSPKYAWLPNKPQDPAASWYILPETKEAISAANGTAYLANGEPALLAYHAAGIKNTIATTLSEVGVPPVTVQVLQAMGIKRLLYPIDKDAAGEKSALNWRDALRASGVDYEAFSWGDSAPEKSDANDIWIQVAFDKNAFANTLKNLSALELPLPEIKSFDDNSFGEKHEKNFDETPQGLIEAIASRLGISGWKNNGWSQKNFSSPFREDNQPSAAINFNSGVLHDFGTGESYSPTQVAKQLGIDWKRFYPQHKTRQAVTSVTVKNQTSQNSSTPASTPEPSVTSVTVENISATKFPATKRVNLAYISELALSELGTTNAIRSPLATGKTALISKTIAMIDRFQDNAKILVITHLQALADNIADRLSNDLEKPIETYRNIPMPYRRSVSRLVCSYDSLHTISDNWDFVFIDEHEQFHRHLMGGTMRGGEPARAYQKLVNIVQNAKRVMALDAHLSVTSVTWLEELRGKVTAIENRFRHNWSHIMIQSYESEILMSAFAAASGESKGVVIPTNSRAKSQEYYQLAIERFGKEAVVVINGENSASRESQNFIQKLTAENTRGKTLREIFPKLRILICSPSLATGIDVQAEVSGVFGIFSQQRWVNAFNILQMMMRYRKADERQLTIMGAGQKSEIESWQDVLRQHTERAKNTAKAAAFDIYGLDPVPTLQTRILAHQAMLQADTDRHQMDLLAYVQAVAIDEGFSLQYGEAQNKGIREALKAARKNRKEQEKAAILKAEKVSPEEFEALQQDPDITQGKLQDARHGLQRWHIEFTAGQVITEDLYETLHTSRKRGDFNRLVDLLENIETLKKRDRSEAQVGVLLIKRKHFIRNRDLIDMAGQSVFGHRWVCSNESLTIGDIAQRLEPFLRTHYQEIQLYIDRRLDLSDEPIHIFRRLLKRVGLKLARKQVMIAGERFYVYVLDGEHRDKMQGYARIALNARQERELLQTRTNTQDKRDWSNFDKSEFHGTTEDVYTRWKRRIEEIPF